MEKICMTEEVLERESRAFDTLKGTTIFVTQKDGCFYAYQNICPHSSRHDHLLDGITGILPG